MLGDVAVLMCVYSGDRLDWFVSAVKSVLGQDYGSGEIRIYLGVDGPLPPDIAAWIDENRRLFHVVVNNDSNLGLAKTLNRLLSCLGNEEFVFRMDADDISLPYRFSRQISFLRQFPDVMVVGGAVWEYIEGESVVWLRKYPLEHPQIYSYIAKANPFAHSSVCFRRRFFQAIPGYPERSRYNQDLGLWFKALAKNIQTANLDIPLVCLRLSGDFFRRRGLARGLSEFIYYLCGSYRLHGLSWRMVFPWMRLIMRVLPQKLSRRLYRDPARTGGVGVEPRSLTRLVDS